MTERESMSYQQKNEVHEIEFEYEPFGISTDAGLCRLSGWMRPNLNVGQSMLITKDDARKLRAELNAWIGDAVILPLEWEYVDTLVQMIIAKQDGGND